MKNNKQMQELKVQIEIIEKYYNNFINYFKHFDTETLDADILTLLENALNKAKAWDIFRAKCCKGGKVASKNLSKKERIERAKTANKAKQAKAQKEKERRKQNQIAKHRL